MNREKIYARIVSLIESFKKSPRQWMDAYETFDDIPPPSRSFLDLAYWLSTGKRTMSDLPRTAWTDRLIVFSLGLRPYGLDLILPGDTLRYPRILEFALWRTCENLRFVPSVFITHDLVEKIILSNCRHNPLQFLDSTPEFDYLFTDELLNLSVSNSLGCLYKFHIRGDLPRIRDESIADGLRKSVVGSSFVFILGKRAVITKMMEEGFWLDNLGVLPSNVKLPSFGKNPRNVDEVFARWDDVRQNCSDFTFHALNGFFVAKMESLPEQESIGQLVQTERGRAFLNQYYDHEKILRCSTNNRQVRGFLLEKELGL